MTHLILSHLTASVTELKKHPMATVESTQGQALAILNRNQPVFYCVPAPLYEKMIEQIDDLQLAQIVKERAHEQEISVSLHDL